MQREKTGATPGTIHFQGQRSLHRNASKVQRHNQTGQAFAPWPHSLNQQLRRQRPRCSHSRCKPGGPPWKSALLGSQPGLNPRQPLPVERSLSYTTTEQECHWQDSAFDIGQSKSYSVPLKFHSPFLKMLFKTDLTFSNNNSDQRHILKGEKNGAVRSCNDGEKYSPLQQRWCWRQNRVLGTEVRVGLPPCSYRNETGMKVQKK